MDMATTVEDPNFTIVHLQDVLRRRPRIPEPSGLPKTNMKQMESVQRELGHKELGHGELGHGELGHGEVGHGELGHEEIGHEELESKGSRRDLDLELEVVDDDRIRGYGPGFHRSSPDSDSEEMFDLVIEDPLTGKNVIIATSNDVSQFDGKEVRYSPETETFVIRNPNSPSNYGRRKLDRVLKDISNTSIKYRIRSKVYKFLNILMLASMLASEAVAIYFTVAENNLASTILMIIALCLTGIYGLFKIGSIGINYRRYAYMLDELYRQGESAKITFDTDEQFDNYANTLSSEVAEITYTVFRMSYGPGNTKSNDSKSTLSNNLSSNNLSSNNGPISSV
jgi:hypothetical protein